MLALAYEPPLFFKRSKIFLRQSDFYEPSLDITYLVPFSVDLSTGVLTGELNSLDLDFWLRMSFCRIACNAGSILTLVP